LWRAIELRLLATFEFPEPLLDVGCGDGSFARLLFAAGGDITGVDPDASVLDKAAAAGAYRRVLQADATRLPFDDQSFAAVLSNCVLEHIPDDRAVVGEMARVLRPGGTVAITVPAPGLKDGLYTVQELRRQGKIAEAEEYLRQFDQRQVHHHYRTAAEWRQIFAAAGLEVVQVTPYLSAAVMDIWDRIEGYFGQPVIRTVLTRKLGAILIRPLALRRLVAHWLLYRHYQQEVPEGEPHGCWLIAARKPN
jgi:ubiquinone/menaquinone biosynthesis C-methylase UbiE